MDSQLGALAPGAGGSDEGDPRALCAAAAVPEPTGGEGPVLSGVIISLVGSRIIGIIYSPGFFSDKLIPCQGRAV